MGRILEGFWDCKYCGTTHIGGRHRECPNCGKARSKDTEFYLGTERNYVPKNQSRDISRNPDWVCEFCQQLNSDNDTVCKYCGSSRTKRALNYFQAKLPSSAHDSYNGSDSNSGCTEQMNSGENISASTPTCKASDQPSRQKSSKSVKEFLASHCYQLLITLLLVAGIVGMVFLFLPKELEITINEFTWTRTIDIERYQTVEESSWSLPSNSRLLYSQLEIHHYQSVIDHYEIRTRQVAKQRISGYETYVSGYRDLGNGYFEEITSQRPIYETYYETETYQEPVYRDEPVYKTKYYYEIEKWLYERSVLTNGSGKSPYWGETNLSSDERIASRSETYSIIGLDSKGEEETIILSFEDWSSLEVGQTVKLRVSIGGHGEIIEE